ncbi:MAG: endoglucanase Acf2 [Rubritalea sp.]|jgi:endoglucanase Acf2
MKYKFLLLSSLTLSISHAAITSLGAGSYRTDLPDTSDGKPRRSIQVEPLVSNNITGPIPTNDWWSSLVWPAYSPHSMPMFPHPLAVQAHADGLAISYSSKPTVSDHFKDGKPFQKGTNYRYPFRESMRIGLQGIETKDTVLDAFSDWSVTAFWKKDTDTLRATFAHGSPFVFFEKTSHRPLQIKFNSAKINSNQEPVDPQVVEWKKITAKHNGKPADIKLSINAGKFVGIGTKARLVYDFDGDGKTDRTETFSLFATDPSEQTWENYSSEKQALEPQLTQGEMRDFNNGTIRLEVWKCFGKGLVTLRASDSQITLPDGSKRGLGEKNLVIGEVNPNASIAKTFYHKGNILGVTLNGSHFGIYAPSGTELIIKKDLVLADIPFLSIAVLPDSKEATIKYYEKFAYAFIRDTKITYAYDQEKAMVTTNYSVKTQPMQGSNKETLFALYRHQHLHATDKERFEKYTYASPRGEMKVISGESFSTSIPFLGVLPALPNANAKDATLIETLKKDTKGFTFKKDDTYWNGKEFGKVTELIQIADQLQQNEIRDRLLGLLKARLADWFDGKDKYFFHYNKRWNTLIGYPDSYGSAEQLNDHHFHYSYFIRAAATIAQYDPDWTQPERYGKMIDILIRDCASDDRDDKLFPWMRNFDPYAGHSWAAGHAGFASGNNQESSSESMNFATSLILYGQATKNKKIRDLGIYWHSTEAEAIKHYWFDLDRKVFPTGYQQSCVGMVWGDGASYGTWWTANPEEIHGINFLPINGGSLYLGRDTDYLLRNLENLKSANRSFHKNGFEGDPENYDRWQDILAEYLALADPAAAKKLLGTMKESELGESKTHSLQWISSLEKLGSLEEKISANHPTAIAFKNGYAIYIPKISNQPVTVKFSDGKTIKAPHGLTFTAK